MNIYGNWHKNKVLDQEAKLVYYTQYNWKLQESYYYAVAALVSMEMSSLQTVVIIAVVAAASFTPVVLQFCYSYEATTSHSFRSRWNTSVSHLLQNLDQFKVSSKKLMGKSDPLLF